VNLTIIGMMRIPEVGMLQHVLWPFRHLFQEGSFGGHIIAAKFDLSVDFDQHPKNTSETVKYT